ncbi:hypothetical protein [Jannaschia rubra]|uniref:hypothetical protein n=1 Tax=Jannaschia rubra TaxID=282197 RepID=UPI00248FED2E|nr:hypothetical protein [Jannaschia rubra]
MDHRIGIREQGLQRAGHGAAVVGAEPFDRRTVLGEDRAILVRAETGRIVVFEEVHHDAQPLSRHSTHDARSEIEQDHDRSKRPGGRHQQQARRTGLGREGHRERTERHEKEHR